jgi:hypothetical protein
VEGLQSRDSVGCDIDKASPRLRGFIKDLDCTSVVALTGKENSSLDRLSVALREEVRRRKFGCRVFTRERSLCRLSRGIAGRLASNEGAKLRNHSLCGLGMRPRCQRELWHQAEAERCPERSVIIPNCEGSTQLKQRGTASSSEEWSSGNGDAAVETSLAAGGLDDPSLRLVGPKVRWERARLHDVQELLVRRQGVDRNISGDGVGAWASSRDSDRGAQMLLTGFCGTARGLSRLGRSQARECGCVALPQVEAQLKWVLFLGVANFIDTRMFLSARTLLAR